MTVTPADLVRREVIYCVSSLVSTLASGYGALSGAVDLGALAEQAMELASPIDDWEEAAIQEGWTGPHVDKFGATFFRCEGDDATWCCADWADLCAEESIDPYAREVFEHWIVSDWLADKLAAHGEKVDKDFAGMIVWARTTTGQGIAADSVIETIAAELNAA